MEIQWRDKIKTLKILNENNIKNYLFISPILPFIADWKSIVDDSAELADEILFENLNIRGNNKKKVLEVYSIHFPKEYEKLINILNEKTAYEEYISTLENDIREYCEKNNIKYSIYFMH